MIQIKQEEIKDYVAIFASVANGAIASEGLPEGSADSYQLAMKVELTSNNLFEHMRKNIQITN